MHSDGSACEMDLGDTRGGLSVGLGLNMHDDSGPHELQERRSVRSDRSSAI